MLVKILHSGLAPTRVRTLVGAIDFDAVIGMNMNLVRKYC